MCRALGIAARPVTNFSSAHDTHGSMTIDMFVGTDGKMMEELNSDMIWNFHVWNEVSHPPIAQFPQPGAPPTSRNKFLGVP